MKILIGSINLNLIEERWGFTGAASPLLIITAFFTCDAHYTVVRIGSGCQLGCYVVFRQAARHGLETGITHFRLRSLSDIRSPPFSASLVSFDSLFNSKPLSSMHLCRTINN